MVDAITRDKQRAFVLTEEWEKGTPSHEIGRLLEVTPMTVIFAAARLGIERPWRREPKKSGVL